MVDAVTADPDKIPSLAEGRKAKAMPVLVA